VRTRVRRRVYGARHLARLAGRRRSISVPGRPLSVMLATESCVNLTRDAVDLPAESAAVGRHD